MCVSFSLPLLFRLPFTLSLSLSFVTILTFLMLCYRWSIWYRKKECYFPNDFMNLWTTLHSTISLKRINFKYRTTHTYIRLVVLIPFDLFRFSIGTNSYSSNLNKRFDSFFSRSFQFIFILEFISFFHPKNSNNTRIKYILMQKKERRKQQQRKTRTSNHWTHVWFYFHSITSYFTLK